MVNYHQCPPKCNREECYSLGIVSDTMMKSPTNLSCGSQRMGMQTGEDKKLLMLTTCCKTQGWETQVNCRQSWWTEGAGRDVCSTRGVLKDDLAELSCMLTENTKISTERPMYVFNHRSFSIMIHNPTTSIANPVFWIIERKNNVLISNIKQRQFSNAYNLKRSRMFSEFRAEVVECIIIFTTNVRTLIKSRLAKNQNKYSAAV